MAQLGRRRAATCICSCSRTATVAPRTRRSIVRSSRASAPARPRRPRTCSASRACASSTCTTAISRTRSRCGSRSCGASARCEPRRCCPSTPPPSSSRTTTTTTPTTASRASSRSTRPSRARATRTSSRSTSARASPCRRSPTSGSGGRTSRTTPRTSPRPGGRRSTRSRCTTASSPRASASSRPSCSRKPRQPARRSASSEPRSSAASTSGSGMANPHYGEIGDVWKHLVLGDTARPAAARAVLGDARRLGHVRARPIVGARVRGVAPAARGAPRTGDQRVAVHRARPHPAARRRRDTPVIPGPLVSRWRCSATRPPTCCATSTRAASPTSPEPHASSTSPTWSGWSTRTASPRSGPQREALSPEEAATTFVLLDPFDVTERSADGMDALDLFASSAVGGLPIALWYGYDDTADRDAIRSRTGLDERRDAVTRRRDGVPARVRRPCTRGWRLQHGPRERRPATSSIMSIGSAVSSPRATTRCRCPTALPAHCGSRVPTTSDEAPGVSPGRPDRAATDERRRRTTGSSWRSRG